MLNFLSQCLRCSVFFAYIILYTAHYNPQRESWIIIISNTFTVLFTNTHTHMHARTQNTHTHSTPPPQFNRMLRFLHPTKLSLSECSEWRTMSTNGSACDGSTQHGRCCCRLLVLHLLSSTTYFSKAPPPSPNLSVKYHSSIILLPPPPPPPL